MQQLDAITLKQLALELEQWLDNAKVSKIQHPSADEFLITFWGGNAARPDNLLYINVNRQHPFCALTGKQALKGTMRSEFEKPTTFCMLLRKHLSGATTVGVETSPGERVMNLAFENFNELGNRVQLVLSLEFMGKHTNMILYDVVQEMILGVAHGVGEHMSQYRELAPGLTYVPPPPQTGKKLLLQTTEDEFRQLYSQAGQPPLPEFINRHFAGVGKRLIEDALALNPDPVTVFRVLQRLDTGESVQPGIWWNENRFSLIQPNNRDWQSYPDCNAMIGAYFLSNLRDERLGQNRSSIMRVLETQLHRVEKRDREQSPPDDQEISQLQACGDRLLAALSSGEVPAQPEPRKGIIALTHYDTGKAWEIEIDPSLSWVENAQVYYRRAKKGKNRRDAYREMAEAIGDERRYLEELMAMTAQAESIDELLAIREDLESAGYVKRNAPPPKKQTGEEYPRGAVLKLVSSEGFPILVGKSGQGNDLLVGRLARPEDLWLHVHQMPGSHVLIKTDKRPVENQTLWEAANLAVYYSSARRSLNVPVIYTESRYVRKIPRSYPGHVNYREEQTVFITPEPTLVEKLLSQD